MAANTAVTGLSIPDYDFDYQFKAPVGTIMRDSKGIPMVKTGDGVWQANDGALLYAYAAAQNDPAIAAALGSDYLERAKTNALASQNSSYYQDALSMNYGLAPTGSGSQATPTSYATGNTQSNNANYSAGTQQSQSQPQTQQTSSSSYNTTPAATQTQQQANIAPMQLPQYQAYDYSNVLNAANQAPAQYQAYDYGKALGYADQTTQHQNYDYGKSLDYADRAMTTTDMGQATNAYSVQDQINKAANTLSQSSFQDGTLVGQLTGDILNNLNPVRQQQQNTINQQFDASRRALQESQAARGGSRSGAGVNQLMALEQARNQQLAQAQASLVQEALAQALPFGQLALSEKGLLQGQQQTAANQLASLLGQQESSRQWSEGFNADQLQRQFANLLAAQQAQASENQFGSQFTSNELQRQFANTLAAQQAQASEGQFASQFGADQTQRQFANLLAASQLAAEEGKYGQQFGLEGAKLGLEYAKLSQDERQFAQSLGLDYDKLSQQDKQFVAEMSDKQAQREQDARQFTESLGLDYDKLTQQDKQFYAQLAEQQATREQNAKQFTESLGLDYAKLAQQEKQFYDDLANQIAQQGLANAYTEAAITGYFIDSEGNKVKTLDSQKLDLNELLADKEIRTRIMTAYLESSPNVGVPKSSTEWLELLFSK